MRAYNHWNQEIKETKLKNWILKKENTLWFNSTRSNLYLFLKWIFTQSPNALCEQKGCFSNPTRLSTDIRRTSSAKNSSRPFSANPSVHAVKAFHFSADISLWRPRFLCLPVRGCSSSGGLHQAPYQRTICKGNWIARLEARSVTSKYQRDNAIASQASLFDARWPSLRELH